MKAKTILAVLIALCADFANAGLREDFENPPPEVKVGCYYYWVNERVDSVGVRKDLEWMKSVGITRAFLCTDIRNRYRANEPFGAADEKHATDDWNFETLKPYADKFFHKGINATILHVVISQPGDDTEPPVRPWFGTFFDRRSKNAADTKRLVDYCRRCNFMLQAGRPYDGKTDERILDDGTIIRFTPDSLFEVTFPDGHKETWNPERPKENRNEV